MYISVNDTVYAFACVFASMVACEVACEVASVAASVVASVVASEIPCVVASMLVCEVACVVASVTACVVASVTASVVDVQRVVPRVVTVDGCIVVNRAVVADLVSGVLLDGFVKPQGYNRFN